MLTSAVWQSACVETACAGCCLIARSCSNRAAAAAVTSDQRHPTTASSLRYIAPHPHLTVSAAHRRHRLHTHASFACPVVSRHRIFCTRITCNVRNCLDEIQYSEEHVKWS